MRIAECQRIPWWAGVAWFNPSERTAVILPIGLHYLAGVVRRAWHEFKLGYRGESAIDAAHAAGYKVGVESAQNAAYDRGVLNGENRTLRLVAELVTVTKRTTT